MVLHWTRVDIDFAKNELINHFNMSRLIKISNFQEFLLFIINNQIGSIPKWWHRVYLTRILSMLEMKVLLTISTTYLLNWCASGTIYFFLNKIMMSATIVCLTTTIFFFSFTLRFDSLCNFYENFISLYIEFRTAIFSPKQSMI